MEITSIIYSKVLSLLLNINSYSSSIEENLSCYLMVTLIKLFEGCTYEINESSLICNEYGFDVEYVVK